MSETAQAKATHASPQQRELPSGWRLVLLGEVCEIIAGQSPPGSTYRTSPEGLPFFQGKADFGKTNPIARVWCVEPTKIARPGDILISVRAPVGPTNIADVDCCIGRGLSAIRCGKNSDLDFILNALRHFEATLVKKGSGSTFEAINRDHLESLEIPLPPLSEQRHIAGVLREQMAVVEKARMAAQARLAAVKALPAAFLRQVFPQPGQPLPDGWRWVKFPDAVRRFNPHLRKLKTSEYQRSGSFPIIDQGQQEIVGYTNDQSCIIEAPLPLVVFGDHTKIAKHINRPFALGADGVVLLSTKKDIDSKFFYYWLSQVDLRELGYARHFSVLKNKDIPLSPLDEQERIVVELRSQTASVEKIRAAVEEELATINALPAALLRRAFNGEL